MAQLATDKPRNISKKKEKVVYVPVVGESADGKIPPQAVEIEDEIIGALMIDQTVYPNIADILTPQCFYKPSNRKIFEAILHLARGNEPTDMLTVMQQLKKDGTLEEVGGVERLSELTGRITSTARHVYYANIIAQKSLARDLIGLANNVLEKAYDESQDVDEIMQEAEGNIFMLSQRSQKRDVEQIDPIIADALEHMRLASQNDNNMSGIPSGFTDLDKITSGWQNSDLIIIAARPAMGKTAFVLSMAKNMAVDYKTPVALFSLEMSKRQLVNRLIMNVCEIEGDKVRNGKLTAAEWNELDHSITRLTGAPIYVDDTPSLSVFELRSKARQLVNNKGVRCIIIDYLQLMNASGLQFGSREQEVSTISRNLKALAKELDIPIIALSQLNRSVESRGSDKNNAVDSKRPQLSDLRESGAIEQDADMVCFIHRPEYYHIYNDSEGNDTHGMAQIIVAKHRNGAVGDVTLRFIMNYAKFANKEAYATDNNDSSPTTTYQTISSNIGAKMASMGDIDTEQPF